MSAGDRDKPQGGSDKAERLAAALRANLRRRKAYARGDGAGGAPAGEGERSGDDVSRGGPAGGAD